MSRSNSSSRIDSETGDAESCSTTTRYHAAVGVGDVKEDPKREWELAPFKEVLERFVQSEEIIVMRPSSQLSVNLQHIISDQPITPSLKSSKHSIVSLLQLYEVNKALKAEENNENKRRCPTPTSNSMNDVRTQTIPSKADGDVCSWKNTGGDDYDEESFLSYDSNCNNILALDTSERPRSCVQRAEETEAYDVILTPQNDENSPPHDGACPSSQNKEGNLDDEISRSQKACAIAAELDVPPQYFLQQNQKGCAWVFDLNEEAAFADTSTGSGNESNQRGLNDSEDSEEYSSSFLSDDV
jgi:hypothetical protein